MFRKTIIGAAVIAAAAGAVLLTKTILDRLNDEQDSDQDEDDDQVHFIKIDADPDDADEEEKEPSPDASDKPQQVQEVCGVYPYLDPDFVEGMLAKNGEFNGMFENDTLITVTHKVTFEDHANLESFLDIMDAAGYICVQLSDHEMTAQKKLFTEEGAILSDILNVANQTAALHGVYESQVIAK
ncbi:MAG: hypothetical protein GX478_00510 [Erysipelotrichaceae bacterium]|jgi:hypothetical protein|nr:hypothetical protein [Erysipelotrichaceae bacterium]